MKTYSLTDIQATQVRIGLTKRAAHIYSALSHRQLTRLNMQTRSLCIEYCETIRAQTAMNMSATHCLSLYDRAQAYIDKHSITKEE